MRWFRYYDDALHDPKVQKLPAELFKVWVNLLCLASKGEKGVLPPIGDIAYALRISESDVTANIKILKVSGLIDETKKGLIPHNWEGRQYASDSSAERMRRHRAAKRDSHSDVTVTQSVTAGDAAGDAAEQNRTDSEKKRKKDSVAADAAVTALFDEWYAAYPRHIGKPAALTKYKTALKKADHKTLLAAARRAATQYADKEQEFIPHPATWLHQERWLDEVVVKKPYNVKDDPNLRGMI